MNSKNITMNDIKRFGLFFIMAVGVGFCVSLSLKADIGLGAWDALSQSLSYLKNIKIGTISIILNTMLVLGQIFLLRKDYKWINLLQFAVSFIMGWVVNFFYYDFFENFNPESYLIRLVLLVSSCLLMAFCLSFIVTLDVIGMPIEFFCAAVARVFHLEFGKVRQYFDFIMIGVVVLITLIFNVTFTLREGTVIVAFLLGPMISFFIPYAEKILFKLELI